jgi:hypothetical protein
MKFRNSITVAAVMLLALGACNLPSESPEPGPPAAQASPTAAAAPSATLPPPPTDIPLPTLTPTPTIPIAWPSDKGVNCRYGPGTEWVTTGSLLVGQTAPIKGRNDDSSWWYVVTPNDPGTPCWVAASVTLTAGNLSGLLYYPPPTAKVTKVTVNADPSFTACGGPNVIGFSGTITTNGPAEVSFRWEVGGDKTNTTSPENLSFSAADTQNVPDPGAYKADCGHYYVILHVLTPNDIQDKDNFAIP